MAPSAGDLFVVGQVQWGLGHFHVKMSHMLIASLILKAQPMERLQRAFQRRAAAAMSSMLGARGREAYMQRESNS